jgi:hypothetical protein
MSLGIISMAVRPLGCFTKTAYIRHSKSIFVFSVSKWNVVLGRIIMILHAMLALEGLIIVGYLALWVYD